MTDHNKTLAEIILNHVHVNEEERDQLNEIVTGKKVDSKSEVKK